MNSPPPDDEISITNPLESYLGYQFVPKELKFVEIARRVPKSVKKNNKVSLVISTDRKNVEDQAILANAHMYKAQKYFSS